MIPRVRRDDVVFNGQIHDLAVLQDEYMIEVFINGGEQIVCAVLC